MARIAIVAILLSSVILVSLWLAGVFGGILPDPPPGDGILPDGIAEISGTVFDSATGRPLTLVLVKCGQLQSYTGSGSNYSLEVDLANPMGCGGLLSADVSSAYFTGHASAELNDLVPAIVDIFVEPR